MGNSAPALAVPSTFVARPEWGLVRGLGLVFAGNHESLKCFIRRITKALHTGDPYRILFLLQGLLLLLGACRQPIAAPAVKGGEKQVLRSQAEYRLAHRLAEGASTVPELAYVPLIPEHRPLVTIRLAMHVFQDEKGENNFQDTPGHRAILQSFIDHVNNIYSNLPAHHPAVDSLHVADSRIRFKLEEVFFYQDRRGFDMADSVCGPYYTCGPNLYKQFVLENERLTADQKEGMLHILLGEHPYEDKRFQAGGSASGIGSKKFILTRGYYWYYFHHPYLDWARKYVPGNIAHELGHSLGLIHTFSGGLLDRKGEPVKLASGSSNNLLDYGSWNSLTPVQIGTIHRTIESNIGQLQDVQLKDYCTNNPKETISIRAGEDILWSSPRRLKGDLVVENGARLTLGSRLGMPAGSRIIVRKGGWLVVEEEAELTGNCGQLWDSLQVEGRGKAKKTVAATGFPKDHGRVDRR
jgi:hypothetical protein